MEVLKDRWNGEIEKMVRNVQTTDWEQKRVEYEGRISRAWSTLRKTEAVQDLGQKARDVKNNMAGTAKEVEQEAEGTKESARQPRLLELK